MQFWDAIINTALIGTEKKQPDKDSLPAALHELLLLATSDPALEKEEQFLQLIAAGNQLRQCGYIPVHKEIPWRAALQDEKPVANPQALQLLQDVIREEQPHLLLYWLTCCRQQQQIVSPAWIPVILQQAVKNKDLQVPAAACCGERGKWIASFNSDWNFSQATDMEEAWQTGTSEQRKQALTQILEQDPPKARDWLQQTWPQEDAAAKTSFLDILETSAGETDILFLESLLNEKSKKVKEAAWRLLKKIPESPLVRSYEEVLHASLQLKKEKTLLGMMSKTVLSVQLPADIPAAVFASGIDKLSNSKAFSDDEYIVYQLLQFVPPVSWEKKWQLSPGAIIELFSRDEPGKKLFPSLVAAVINFKDSKWAAALAGVRDQFFPDILVLLQEEEQEAYSLRHFNDQPDEILIKAVERTRPWSAAFADRVFSHAAKKPHQFNRGYFSQCLHLVPAGALQYVQQYAPAEEYLRSYWNNTAEYITKMVQLRSDIKKAFHL